MGARRSREKVCATKRDSSVQLARDVGRTRLPVCWVCYSRFRILRGPSESVLHWRIHDKPVPLPWPTGLWFLRSR